MSNTLVKKIYKQCNDISCTVKPNDNDVTATLYNVKKLPKKKRSFFRRLGHGLKSGLKVVLPIARVGVNLIPGGGMGVAVGKAVVGHLAGRLTKHIESDDLQDKFNELTKTLDQVQNKEELNAFMNGFGKLINFGLEVNKRI